MDVFKLENKTAYTPEQQENGSFLIVNITNGKFIKLKNRTFRDVALPEMASTWKGQENVTKIIDSIMELEPKMRVEFRLFENKKVL